MPQTLFTFQSILRGLRIAIDFLIIWVVIYYVLKIVRNNSRTVQIFKGIILIIALWYLAKIMGFSTLRALLNYVVQYSFLVIIMIFQPEIRGMLERLGKASVFSSLHSLSLDEKEKLVEELVEAATALSAGKIGALISIEQGHSLSDYIKTGTPINSNISSELLRTIFNTATPLHDGAVIIQGYRIACASAYFPPTNLDLPSSYGARHRAAIGISEVTDSVTIVVSEETGRISIAESGRLREMDPESLREYLNILIRNTEKEVSQSIGVKRSRRMSLSRMNVDPLKVEKSESEDLVLKPKDKEGPQVSKMMSVFKKKKKEIKENIETVEVETQSDVVEMDDDILDNEMFSKDEGGERDES